VPEGGRECTRRQRRHARGGRFKTWGPRARAKRTENMRLMSVTLEVSKLSGWLNADAYCRVEGRGRAMRGGERGASREAGGPGVWWRHTKAMHGDGPTQGLGAKGTRGAHVEHDAHVRDAGGVEAQRLVEHRRVLPSRGEGMRCGGQRCASREAGGPGVWWRHTRGMHGKGTTQGLGAKGTRGAHVKHLAHDRDAGGVEA